MPANAWFIAFIAIVTIIRLGLIMAGPMDARAKTDKIANWIIGLVVVVIAWLVLGKIWGVETDGFKGKQPTETTTTSFDDSNTNVNNQSYYGSGYDEQTQDVPIKIQPKK
ncbi:hypothetical protein [Chryseobacterium oncorhynchi]|uniref:Uncharacterized protein n=1 Tax=Chryseobacterium oncorhynchi TaxID=741074 RepID=A0A316WHW4_9FLAO|nr:hypothetical protein [Chryseobacterium oncorhynchi]PWN59973.1 hypothetical protein C1638_020615 [Chryseobacterium oncorhynchi]